MCTQVDAAHRSGTIPCPAAVNERDQIVLSLLACVARSPIAYLGIQSSADLTRSNGQTAVAVILEQWGEGSGIVVGTEIGHAHDCESR